MKHLTLLTTLLAFAMATICSTTLAAEPASAEKTHAAAQEQARQYAEQFYLKKLAPLHERFTADMKAAMNFEAFSKTRDQIDIQLGSETEVLGERVEPKDDYLIYVRRSRFSKFPGVIEVRWVLNQELKIAGLFFTPEKQPSP